MGLCRQRRCPYHQTNQDLTTVVLKTMQPTRVDEKEMGNAANGGAEQERKEKDDDDKAKVNDNGQHDEKPGGGDTERPASDGTEQYPTVAPSVAPKTQPGGKEQTTPQGKDATADTTKKDVTQSTGKNETTVTPTKETKPSKEQIPDPSSTTTSTTVDRNGDIVWATFPQGSDSQSSSSTTSPTSPGASNTNSTRWLENNCRLDGLHWFPNRTFEAWQQRAPFVVFMGASQAGVPSLSKAMLQHPQFVDQSHSKDLHFFTEYSKWLTDQDDVQKARENTKLRDEGKINVRMARDHLYARHFTMSIQPQGTSDNDGAADTPSPGNGNVDNNDQAMPMYTLDATQQYFFESKTVPKRLFCVSPWAKLILMVRNPIERLMAQFEFAIRQEKWRDTLDNWILQDWQALKSVGLDPTHTAVTSDVMESWKNYQQITTPVGPMANGLYTLALHDWVETIKEVRAQMTNDDNFPKEQLLVLRYKDWKERPSKVLDRITEFLGIDAFPDAVGQSLEQRETSTTPRSDQADVKTRQMVENFYEPFQRQLCRDLQWPEDDDCMQTEIPDSVADDARV